MGKEITTLEAQSQQRGLHHDGQDHREWEGEGGTRRAKHSKVMGVTTRGRAPTDEIAYKCYDSSPTDGVEHHHQQAHGGVGRITRRALSFEE